MDRQGLQPDDPIASQLPYVGVENVDSNIGSINFNNNSRAGSQKSTTFRFNERHVLYARLRPYLNKIATPGFVGKCSTELIPLLPRDGVNRDFIAHLLRRKQTVEYAMASVTGSRMPRTDMDVLMSMQVPLPSPDEQYRISTILNRATKIEQLHMRATERLQEFIPTLFIKMFGNPEINSMEWEVRPFLSLVEDKTRSVKKIQKKTYSENGKIPIVDQGKQFIAGYTDLNEDYYEGQLPVIIFGDHTRRFKLIRFRFFLGADGVKLLLPTCGDLDPVFLFGQLQCLTIDEAGYSRHYKFLKSKHLILPPIQQQLRFRALFENIETVSTLAETAEDGAKSVTASLMDQLLEGAR